MKHVLEVQQAEPGQALRMGLVNGLMGEGLLLGVRAGSVVV
jgi:hypothetical protein